MGKMKIFLIVFAVLFIMAASVVVYDKVVMAQDAAATAEGDAEGEPEKPKISGMTLGLIISAGGPVGAFIILCSVAALALVIEYSISMKKEKLAPAYVVAEINNLLDEERYEDAIAYCEAHPCFFSNMMKAAIGKIGTNYSEIEAAMLTIAEFEAFKLNRKVGYLSLLGSISPMLGLTGTVTGMIGAFIVIANTTNPTPALLATGVFEALITTAEGLFVCIPVLTAYFFLKNIVTTLVLEMANLGGDTIYRFKPVVND